MSIKTYFSRNWHILVSVAYLGFFLGLFFKATSFGNRLDLNELGDFLAGVVGPLALFWLVLGFFQQGKELQNNVAALKLQTQELKASVKQQSEMAKAAQIQNALEEKHERDRRERKLSADRALLGFALHDLHDIFLNASRQAIFPKAEYKLNWDKIVDCCETVGKCVENADPESSKVLASIMAKAQYLTARHKEALESKALLSSDDACDEFLLDTLIVFRSDIAVQMLEFVLICAAGFKYARLNVDRFEEPQFDGESLAASFCNYVSHRAEGHPLWKKIQYHCNLR
ncbi:hypothetical protein [Ruegeria arenilitoris]|uniref:hypothetical protein n=1 Tax=Ruegeria arenilitoris TaxID=1173585 RepID=UPI00147D8694|nr:hypothetical protein [Ruegeria arenilitoris]